MTLPRECSWSGIGKVRDSDSNRSVARSSHEHPANAAALRGLDMRTLRRLDADYHRFASINRFDRNVVIGRHIGQVGCNFGRLLAHLKPTDAKSGNDAVVCKPHTFTVGDYQFPASFDRESCVQFNSWRRHTHPQVRASPF